MAPLTLTEKYNDLVRCADQPLSSYDKLTSEDLTDVVGKIWPFIIESITYTPSSSENNYSLTSIPSCNGEVHTKLDRRLKIHYQLYSEVAKKYQQKFPNRKPIRRKREHTNMHVTDIESLSVDTSATFSLDNVSEMNMPDFYVFCPPEHSNERGYRNYGQFSSTTSIKQRQKDFDCVKKYIMTTIQTSPYKILVFKQALKECCRCGNYSLLENLCLAADIPIENVYFDNNDTVIHESIKLNNKQLTSELIRHKFNINVDGELGTPLVTAIHYNILWAVEILLNNGPDLTKHHIDWPFLTLYEYCIQFAKIDIKLMIDKHITSLIRDHNYTTIRRLVNDGWKICLKKKQHIHNTIRIQEFFV